MWASGKATSPHKPVVQVLIGLKYLFFKSRLPCVLKHYPLWHSQILQLCSMLGILLQDKKKRTRGKKPQSLRRNRSVDTLILGFWPWNYESSFLSSKPLSWWHFFMEFRKPYTLLKRLEQLPSLGMSSGCAFWQGSPERPGQQNDVLSIRSDLPATPGSVLPAEVIIDR